MPGRIQLQFHSFIIKGRKEVHAGKANTPPRGIKTTETGEEKENIVLGVS